MSAFPKEIIKNISESIGILNLKDEVATALSQDVEYRIYEIIQEAAKFMRHSKRTKLLTEDIDYALRARNVEPLYGHGAFGETTFKKVSALAEDIYVVEDEEFDFEKLLSTPLPPAPRDTCYTAHWLAVEGVQPLIRQNPAPNPESTEPVSKKPRAATTTINNNNNALPEASAQSSATATVPVKLVLSKELQLYYERLTEALLADNDLLRSTALDSLAVDPGIHQLIPYFTQFIAHQVTHHLKDLRLLTTMVLAARALLSNPRVFMEPYLHQLMPALLTCLVGKRLGGGGPTPASATVDANQMDEDTPHEASALSHWALRDTAAEVVARVCLDYGPAYHTLQQRVTRTLLRAFLDPTKPLATHYGALVGLTRLGAPVVKLLILPNIKAYSALLLAPSAKEERQGEGEGVAYRAPMAGPGTAEEREKCWNCLVDAVESIQDEGGDTTNPTGSSAPAMISATQNQLLEQYVGPEMARRLVARHSAWSAIPVALQVMQNGPVGGGPAASSATAPPPVVNGV
ncbi:histone H4-like TAF Taf6, SAGA complex subunit [Dimargaris cristalligena]|nr:histone H4-like TAF Taf6, SAGA complex subunit [Dimargaris cristalligena]